MWSDDGAFVQAIIAARSYDEAAVVRLVYADWLEERGDPRAELLRLDCALAGLSYEDARRGDVERRLQALRPQCSFVWQALACYHDLEPLQKPTTKEAGPVACPNSNCASGNPLTARTCRQCQYPLALPAGTLVAARYRVDATLALGTVGYVYRAVDLTDGQVAVVKEVTGDSALDFACLLPLLKQEATLLRNLQAIPQVPRWHDFIEMKQAAYLVVEYLGTDSLLWQALNFTFQPLPFAQVVAAAQELCDMLQALHGQTPPLVCELTCDHLYLAAEKVRVLPAAPGQRRAKVAMETLRQRLEGRGFRIGCYADLYKPSERMCGVAEPRTNLFDLAGALYLMLTGRPSDGSFTARAIGRVLDGVESPPLAEDQRWLYEIIAINLAERPGDRYHSAAALRADLAQHAITREQPCPACGNRNPVRQPYCAKCDEPLTALASQACQSCGEYPRMGSVACRKCGKRHFLG